MEPQSDRVLPATSLLALPYWANSLLVLGLLWFFVDFRLLVGIDEWRQALLGTLFA